MLAQLSYASPTFEEILVHAAVLTSTTLGMNKTVEITQTVLKLSECAMLRQSVADVQVYIDRWQHSRRTVLRRSWLVPVRVQQLAVPRVRLRRSTLICTELTNEERPRHDDCRGWSCLAEMNRVCDGRCYSEVKLRRTTKHHDDDVSFKRARPAPPGRPSVRPAGDTVCWQRWQISADVLRRWLPGSAAARRRRGSVTLTSHPAAGATARNRSHSAAAGKRCC